MYIAKRLAVFETAPRETDFNSVVVDQVSNLCSPAGFDSVVLTTWLRPVI